MISPESKMKSMSAKIAQEIVNNLTKSPPRDRMADEVLNQLSQTYGQSLKVVEKTGEEGLAFMVASEKQGDPPLYVSREENESLKKKLFDIAQTIVYRNLSKGGIE